MPWNYCQLFNYFTITMVDCLGLLIVPDSEVPQGEEKTNLKNLYEMFRYTKNHGLVSMQFLGILGIFFGA